MATFHGGMHEQADHCGPWVRLRVDSDAVRLGPTWASVERSEQPSVVALLR